MKTHSHATAQCQEGHRVIPGKTFNIALKKIFSSVPSPTPGGKSPTYMNGNMASYVVDEDATKEPKLHRLM